MTELIGVEDVVHAYAPAAVDEFGVALMTSVRGSPSAKAKRELGWMPSYATWREGFRTGIG